MLINEAAYLCKLTKKAIEYYIEQGLVAPRTLANGYRDFSEGEVERLRQIALYRKLGLGIAEIKGVLADPGEIKPILCRRTLELEEEKLRLDILRRLGEGEAPENLAREIDEIGQKPVIIRKLMEFFPGYFGKFISLNFARYLTGEIKTPEQLAAFGEIIDFLDNVPEIEIPAELQAYLDQYLADYSSEEGRERINRIIQAKEQNMANIDEFIEKNRESIESYLAYKQTEEFKESPANKLMQLMQEICTSSGYYDVFIPAMRRLSPLYNKYYEQMLKADAKFTEEYAKYL